MTTENQKQQAEQQIEEILKHLSGASEKPTSNAQGNPIGNALDIFNVYSALAVSVLESHAPILAKYAEQYRAWSVEQDVKSFKEYVEGGLTEQEAIAIMIANKQQKIDIVQKLGALK